MEQRKKTANDYIAIAIVAVFMVAMIPLAVFIMSASYAVVGATLVILGVVWAAASAIDYVTAYFRRGR